MFCSFLSFSIFVNQLVLLRYMRLAKPRFLWGIDCTLNDSSSPKFYSLTCCSQSRIWLLAHQPTRYCIDRKFRDPPLAANFGKKSQVRNLLPLALETFEYGACLPSEPRIAKWSWILTLPNHILTHLEFYLLVEICYHPFDPLVPRTWKALDEHSSKGYIRDVSKTLLDPFEVILNKFRSRAKDLRDRDTRPSISSIESSGESQTAFQDRSAAGHSSLAGNLWTRPEESLPTDPMPATPLITQPSYSNLISQHHTDEMELQPSFLTDATGTNHTESAPSHSGTTHFGANGPDSGLLGILSSNNSAQNLYDADLGRSTWFQFQDETMGSLMEDYTDGMWENLLLNDLPPMV
jgi:hypothetical protein